MVWFPEKCFDETRYEYLEEGDSWARVHQGRVEQCQCAGGRVQCEDTRHTGTPAGRGAEPSHGVPCQAKGLHWDPPCVRPQGLASEPSPSLPEQPVPERGHLPPACGHRDHRLRLCPGPRREALQHR